MGLVAGGEEGGGGEGWIEAIGPELRQHGGGAAGQHAVFDGIDGILPVGHDVARGMTGGQAGDHLGIAPAGGLGLHGFFQLVGPRLEACQGRSGSEGPAVEEMFPDMIREAQFVFRAGHEVLVHPLGIAVSEIVHIAPAPRAGLINHQ